MTHDPGTVGDVLKGGSASFTIQCEDNIGVTKASILVRFGEDGLYRQMTPEGDGFTLTVSIPRHVEGLMTYNFTVFDAGGNELVSDTYEVNLLNAVPSWLDVPDWTVTEEEEATLDLSSYIEDGNDEAVDLSLSCDSEEIQVLGLTLTALFEEHLEDFDVEVTVSDGEDNATVMITVSIENVNDLPVIDTVQPRDGSIFAHGSTIGFNLTVTDEDGDDLQVEWRDGETVIGTGTQLESSDLSSGVHTITVAVNDGTGEVTTTFTIKVNEKKEEEPTVGPVAALAALALVATVLVSRRARRRDH
jgi:hypothetical protein